MEFNEKLQSLRANANLTQEDLAEKLYVSRTAISKWESGRGYPSIDSLKAIAKYFHVTIDELICGEEMAALAEQDIKASNKKYTALICGILDCLTALLFLLPVFGNGGTDNVSSVALTGITYTAAWLKAVFISAVSLTALNGFCAVVVCNFDKPVRNKHRILTGMGLSVVTTAIFVMGRQPYAATFCLCLLLIKGILLFKTK